MKCYNRILNDRNKKVLFYMFSSILTMVLAFLSNWLMTRMVEPSTYGFYKYSTTFLLTIPTFFEFGLHFSCSRLIAERNTDEKDGVVFTSSIIVTVIGIILSLGLYSIIYFSNNIQIDIGALKDISIVYPFIFIFTLRIIVLQVYQGTGKTNKLAIINLSQYCLIIVGIMIGNVIFEDLTFNFLILLFCGSWFVVMLPFILKMKYSFCGFRENASILFTETKKNGLYVYFGSIVSTSTSSLLSLISGSLYGFEEYGYYSLALSFAQTFTVISSTMAVVNFKDNVNQKYIPSKDIKLMIGLNALMYSAFLIVIKPLFVLFFTSAYLPTINYLIILGLVYSLNGIILYFNRFFVARGLGNETMRNSIFVAIVNIISSLILIPKFEIIGIVFASLISSILSLIKYIVSYKTYIKRSNDYN